MSAVGIFIAIIGLICWIYGWMKDDLKFLILGSTDLILSFLS